MDALWKLRQACAEAIRTCEQTEKQTNQTQQTAVRHRDAELRDTRQKHTQARQSIDEALREVRELARLGDTILAGLALTPEPPGPFAPPDVSVDELTRLFQNHRAQAREALGRLQRAARELEEERSKWWKFW